MELADLFGALRRWWYLAVVVLLLAVGAGFGLSTVRGPSYVAVTSVVLVPPQATVTDATRGSAYAPSNPLLYMSSLNQSRDIVLSALNSPEVADRIADRFPTSSMTASPAAASSGPIVVLTVTSRSPGEALAAMAYAGAQVPVVLSAIQSRLAVDGASRVTAFTLTADTKPEASHKSQLQLSVLGGAGVGLVGFFLLAVMDHLVRTRARGRALEPRAARSTAPEGSSPSSATPTSAPPPVAGPGAAGPDRRRGADRSRDRSEAVLAGSSAEAG